MFGLHQGFRRTSSSSDEESRPPAGRPPLPPASRVKRALFGPTNPEENLRFVRQELKKHSEDASARWNFDFETGNPLSGRLDWQPCARSSLHPAYKLSRMQYISSHEDTFQSSRVTPPSASPTSTTVSALEDQQVGSVLDLRTPEDRLTGPLPPPTPSKSGHSNRSGGSTSRSASRFTSVTSRPHQTPDTAASRLAPPPLTSSRVSGPSLLSSSTSSFTPSSSSISSSASSASLLDARLTSRFARPHPTATAGISVLSDLEGGSQGARPKTKDSKITETFRSRKASRSKSASKLKRLAGNLGRSPSVKARGGRSPPRSKPGAVVDESAATPQ